jgi:hypothetical protein
LWYDGGTIPFGQVKNSRCIVVPGSPGIPNKILVPIYNDFDTNTPAGLYVPPSVLGNSGTWEPVVPDKPMNLFGACAINLKPGNNSIKIKTTIISWKKGFSSACCNFIQSLKNAIYRI